MNAEKIDHTAVGNETQDNHTNSNCCPAMDDEKAATQDPRRASRLGGEGKVSREFATTDRQLPTPAADSTAAQDQFLLNWVRSEAQASPDNLLLAVVAKYGRVFRHANHFPKELCPGLPAQAKANCTQLVLQNDLGGTYRYAEGVILDLGSLVLIPHSWLVNEFGDAIDITRTDTRDTVFIGIAVKTESLQNVVREMQQYGFISKEALQSSSLQLNGDLGKALVDRFSDRRHSGRRKGKAKLEWFMFFKPNDDVTMASVTERMIGDLRDGVITPMTTPRQLKAKYAGVNSMGALTMMMRKACRQFEGLAGSQLLVVDGCTDKIVRSFDRPLEITRRGTKWLERIAVSSITQMIDEESEDDENAYRNRLDVILHVYSMPAGRYQKRAGKLVKDYGQHILTYQKWDKDLEDIEAPFPDHDLTLWPEASYLYRGALGYQGFDGMNWRSD
ncbi:MAG: hypothetical protein RLO18_31255, partial [Gimesia chilikensis]